MIINGDAKQLALADKSIHCCITSPPYFGLRDYGTGHWVGGNATCGHLAPEPQRHDVDRMYGAHTGAGALKAKQYQGVCANCGAQRVDRQIGMEPTAEAYVQSLVEVFREVHRVLRDDGTCWVVLGDCYAGSDGSGRGGSAYVPASRIHQNSESPRRQVFGLKAKDLVGMPWRVAFALQASGWYLRSDIVWCKPNAMPESVTDRPSAAHEFVFLLTKSQRYYYDIDAVREPASGMVHNMRFRSQSLTDDMLQRNGRHDNHREYATDGLLGRNLRNFWIINSEAFPGAHFATFPEKLVEPAILAGSSEKGCCEKCGAPWERVTERHSFARSERGTQPSQFRYLEMPQQGNVGVLVLQVGWKPGCTHNARVVPCVVLDPFIGSGTVGQVSERLGRRWVGVELSPSYLKLARKRTAQLGLFAQVGRMGDERTGDGVGNRARVGELNSDE